MQNLNPTRIFILIAITAGLITVAISMYLLFLAQSQSAVISIEDNKHQTSQIGGNFVLTDQNNKVFKSTDLNGHVSLIYFGYTRCPYHGSIEMEKLVEIKKHMNDSHIPVQIVFITLDPEHDTPKVLKKYLMQFDPTFIGLTGTIKQIKQVADKYRVYYEKQAEGEHFKHSALLYLMKINGSFLKYFCVMPNC